MKKLLQIVTIGCFVLSSWSMLSAEIQPNVRVEVGKSARTKLSCYKTKAPLDTSYHPYYYIKSIGPEGKTLCTYDETIWTVSSSNACIVKTWAKDTPVIIIPNHRWFSKHKYCLKNAITNEIVPVSISQGPIIRYAIFIKEISRWGYVTLSNGTQWSIRLFDSRSSIYKSWSVNHAVIIGESGGWFSPRYMLLNINKNNYLSASLY